MEEKQRLFIINFEMKTERKGSKKIFNNFQFNNISFFIIFADVRHRCKDMITI